MLESCVAISKLFDKLKEKLDNDKAILDFRKKNNLKRIDLDRMFEKDISVIKKWETGKSKMTRASYNKLKKCMI